MDKEQLENEIKLRDALENERKKSDDAYAAKIVERIVWWTIALVATGIIGTVITIQVTSYVSNHIIK